MSQEKVLNVGDEISIHFLKVEVLAGNATVVDLSMGTAPRSFAGSIFG